MIRRRNLTLGAALLGSLCSLLTLQAGNPFSKSLDQPFSKDIRLSDTILTGRYVNLAGTGIRDVRASIRQAGHEVANAITDAQGNFAIPGLRTGVYEVVIGHRSEFIRLWDHDAAPPAAFPAVCFTRDGRLKVNGGTTSAIKLIGSDGNPADCLEGIFGNDPAIKDIPLVFPIVP